MCEEAARLLGLYTSAISAFHRAQTTVPEGKQKTGGGELAWTSRVKEAAHRNLLRARRDYWEHVREHGCRETKGRPAVTPPASRSGVETLWNGLRQAKDQLDLAFDGLNDAREVHASSLSGTADGHYLYQTALESRNSRLRNICESWLISKPRSLRLKSSTTRDMTAPLEIAPGAEGS